MGPVSALVSHSVCWD